MTAEKEKLGQLAPKETAERKRSLRRQFGAARRALLHKESLSQTIIQRLSDLKIYRAADVVLWYNHVRHEVQTQQAVSDLLSSADQRTGDQGTGVQGTGDQRRGRTVVVPYCVDRDLVLFHLEDFQELVSGKYGILEPRAELRDLASKRIRPEDLDLVIVPGVVFDAQGGRLGQGQGYYDRLLRNVPPDRPRVALAFECQLTDRVPRDQHDMLMDYVISETQVYEAKVERLANRPAP